jgi:hypothetical protein
MQPKCHNSASLGLLTDYLEYSNYVLSIPAILHRFLCIVNQTIFDEVDIYGISIGFLWIQLVVISTLRDMM